MTNKGIMVLDDKVEEFGSPGAIIFDSAGAPFKVIVGSNRKDRTHNFRGAVGCVQIYPAALSASAIALHKECEETASVHKSPHCPDSYSHFEGKCYKVSSVESDFMTAELSCMPFPINSLYRTQLMWSADRLHLDFVARLVYAKHSKYDYWVGLDNREAGANWTTSYGEAEITPADDLWLNGNPGSEKCAKTVAVDEGYITSADCTEKRPFVCSTISLDQEPNNICPKDHLPYKGKCFRPSSVKKNYAQATVRPLIFAS